jgi:hypothetical protein
VRELLCESLPLFWKEKRSKPDRLGGRLGLYESYHKMSSSESKGSAPPTPASKKSTDTTGSSVPTDLTVSSNEKDGGDGKVIVCVSVADLDPLDPYMILGLPDPHADPLVRDADPDPSIIKQK